MKLPKFKQRSKGFSMEVKKDLMIKILRRGLMEMRLFSQSKNNDLSRVNSLVELLHNIPDFINCPEKFDMEWLEGDIARHCGKFKHSMLEPYNPYNKDAKL